MGQEPLGGWKMLGPDWGRPKRHPQPQLTLHTYLYCSLTNLDVSVHDGDFLLALDGIADHDRRIDLWKSSALTKVVVPHL